MIKGISYLSFENGLEGGHPINQAYPQLEIILQEVQTEVMLKKLSEGKTDADPFCSNKADKKWNVNSRSFHPK